VQVCASPFVAGVHGPSSLCKPMQARANAAFVSSSECTSVQENAGECKSLAASLLHRKSTDGERTHWGTSLLSVREAARLLGVCAATVYKLCASGELPHTRILNAIRIVPADLAAFVVARRKIKRRPDEPRGQA
jgi:excisionase family DNA binding protein